jgi:hypothetical protein
MEGFAFGLGVLLAVLGPLLLLPAAWLLQRLLRPLLRRLTPDRLSARAAGALGWGATALLLGAILAATWYPGQAEFERLCLRYAVPQIAERVTVDGFYRERLFPYQTRRLFDYGFSYLETEDPQRPHQRRLLRYRPGDDGGVVAEEVAALTSRYGVRQELVETASGLFRTEKRVYDRGDGRLLARAGEVTYDGGPLALFLGAYAVATCPDIRTPEGSRAFQAFYDLEAVVLGGRDLPPG